MGFRDIEVPLCGTRIDGLKAWSGCGSGRGEEKDGVIFARAGVGTELSATDEEPSWTTCVQRGSLSSSYRHSSTRRTQREQLGRPPEQRALEARQDVQDLKVRFLLTAEFVVSVSDT